jgi:hypothetical protein
VPDLERGLGFYRDSHGPALIWRSEKEAGSRMPDQEAEIVIPIDRKARKWSCQCMQPTKRRRTFKEAGGNILVTTFDTQINRCAVVRDP